MVTKQAEAITNEQEKLAFLKLELHSAGKVVNQLLVHKQALETNKVHNSKALDNLEIDLKYWEKAVQVLMSRVFEMEVLLGIEV